MHSSSVQTACHRLSRLLFSPLLRSYRQTLNRRYSVLRKVTLSNKRNNYYYTSNASTTLTPEPANSEVSEDQSTKLDEAKNLIRAGQYNEAILLLQAATSEFQRDGNQKGHLNTLDLLGLALMRMGNLELSRQSFEMALELVRELKEPRCEARPFTELALEYEKEDRMEAKILTQLASLHDATGDTLKASECMEAALQIAKNTLKDTELQIMLHQMLGAFFRGRSFSAAVKELKTAQSLARNENLTAQLLESTIILAQLYSGAQQYDLSNRCYDEVILECEGGGAKLWEWQAFFGLGENYAKMGGPHLKLAVSNFREARALAEDLQDFQLLMKSCHMLSFAVFPTNSSESIECAEFMLQTVRDALKRAQEQQVPPQILQNYLQWEVQTLVNQGNFSKDSDQHAALIHFNEALNAAKKHDMENMVAMTELYLGELNYEIKEFSKALHHYKETLDAAKKAKMKALERDALFRIALVYREMNDVDAAVSANEHALLINEKELANEPFARLRGLTQLLACYRALNQTSKAEEVLAQGASLSQELMQ